MPKIFLVCLVVLISLSAQAMPPEDVKRAMELLKKEEILKTYLKKAKTIDAHMSVTLFIPSSPKDCNERSFGYSFEQEGKFYCRDSTLDTQIMLPSVIADLQKNLDKVQAELCKLGVHKP